MPADSAAEARLRPEQNTATSRLTHQPLSQPERNIWQTSCSHRMHRGSLSICHVAPCCLRCSFTVVQSALLYRHRLTTLLRRVSETIYRFAAMSQIPEWNVLGSGYNTELVSGDTCRWVSQLQCYGQGEGENWGFRIYRTTYTSESDRGKEKTDLTCRRIQTDTTARFRHRPQNPVFTFARSMLQRHKQRRHAEQANLGANEEHSDRRSCAV